MFEVDGKDGVILALGDGWCNPNLVTRGGLCRMVWMFCGLGKVVKDYVVISLLCTKGSVHWVKWRLLVT
jgi:hypothetical protein